MHTTRKQITRKTGGFFNSGIAGQHGIQPERAVIWNAFSELKQQTLWMYILL
jgi:hypothetical protein